MVIEFKEPASIRTKGTIIDLESIGDFDRTYPPWDPRQYASLSPTIFGYITGDVLVQHCAEGEEEIPSLIDTMKDTLPELEDPFYALNTNFERCLIENTCGLKPIFIDVRGRMRGAKWAIREQLGIPTYNDPFNGNGFQCLQEWQKGNYHECMKHNRACLLIERDIHEHSIGLIRD
ncbi:MAG: hypothetical protein ACTSYO_09565 [Candidatus Ranarchaeia archaeon]